jgi:hypothetical protein
VRKGRRAWALGVKAALEPLLKSAGFVFTSEVGAVSSEGALCLFTWNSELHYRAADVVNKAVRQLVPMWFRCVIYG